MCPQKSNNFFVVDRFEEYAKEGCVRTWYESPRVNEQVSTQVPFWYKDIIVS